MIKATTDKLFNICSCGKKVILKRCIWLDEVEDVFNIFTEASKQGKVLKLNPKHKLRKFYFNQCSCGNVFINR